MAKHFGEFVQVVVQAHAKDTKLGNVAGDDSTECAAMFAMRWKRRICRGEVRFTLLGIIPPVMGCKKSPAAGADGQEGYKLCAGTYRYADEQSRM